MKPKALIVDDDQNIRFDTGKTLRRAGFQVSTAVDCISGWEKFEKSDFDIVILDLTMPDFNDEMTNEAGIDFLRRIKASKNEKKAETSVLILTATPTYETAKEALNLGAFTFLEKGELQKNKEKLLQGLKESILKKEKLRQELKENISKDIERNPDLLIKEPEDLEISDEQKEIFQKLFADCKKINISPLKPGYTKAEIFLVDSIDLKGEKLIPFVAKIGKKAQIDAEYDNYRNYVEHKISSGRYPEVIKLVSSDSQNLGGMRISFIGANWKSMLELKTYFEKHTSDDIVAAIENLFEETFRFWHENKGHKESISILKEYSFFADTDRLRAAMDRFFKEYRGHSIIKFEDFDLPFYDAVTSLKIFNDSFKDLKINTYKCTIHGDLNVKNILVDANKNCWLIDFQWTRKGHILTDFVELETSIKYGCFDATLGEFWALEKCLMSQTDFRQEIDFHHENLNIQKAFDVIKKIREYAYLSVSPGRDMTEYYIGLLYYTLNMIRFPEKVISKVKKKSILLTTSLILDKLKEPGMNIGFIGKDADYIQRIDDKEKFKVLIVDDDKNYLTNLYKALDRTNKYEVTMTKNSIEAARSLKENKKEMFNLCILDLSMPDLQGQQSDVAGLDLLKFIKERYTDVPVIILSGFADYKIAVDAISRYGAATYFNKDDIVKNKKEFLQEIDKIIKSSSGQ